MLWDAYQKMLDRRLARFGADKELDDAIAEATTAAHMDFGELPLDATSYPGDKHQAVQRIYPQAPSEFFLPFESVAAEAAVTWWRGEKGRVLLATSRPNLSDTSNLVDDPWPVMLAMSADSQPNTLRIQKGSLRFTAGTYVLDLYSDCRFEITTGKCLSSWCAEPFRDQSETDRTQSETDRLAEYVAQLSAVIFGLLETANSPANWIVKVTDEHARIVKRRGKKTKQQRMRYIVVPDRSLDRVIRASSGAGDFIERSPHRRRAHYRRLSSPRYRLRRGERILVKESWVGPRESVHGGERYTVLTSMPSAAEAAPSTSRK